MESGPVVSASPAAVAAAQKVFGCRPRYPEHSETECILSWHGYGDAWTDRGCPVAVAVADAVTSVATREVLEQAAQIVSDCAAQGLGLGAAERQIRAEAIR